MALSKETAGKINEIIAADVDCQKAIQTDPRLDFLIL
jgi:hypothetical protein